MKMAKERCTVENFDELAELVKTRHIEYPAILKSTCRVITVQYKSEEEIMRNGSIFFMSGMAGHIYVDRSE